MNQIANLLPLANVVADLDATPHSPLPTRHSPLPSPY